MSVPLSYIQTHGGKTIASVMVEDVGSATHLLYDPEQGSWLHYDSMPLA